WIRPFLFLVFIVVAWDLAIRIFKIPAYQIPAPADVVAVLWGDWAELGGAAGAPTHATVWRFLLSGLFRLAPCLLTAGSIAGESEDGRELHLSAVGVFAVGAEGRDRAIVRCLVRLRHHPESDRRVLARLLPGGGLRRAGLQIGRSRHDRSCARHAGQPLPGVL